ncbi:MAG: hypothetical protein E6R04_07270 [Spirochaetes bacterium]|nr:MAG: hypothetical protein E6R04_07270 [Spirochaetota bacterium]
MKTLLVVFALAFLMALSACGPVNITAPISIAPDLPDTVGEVSKPTPTPDPGSRVAVEEPEVEDDREVLVTYTCSATTSGGTQNGLPVFYTLTTYDTMESEATASVGALSQDSEIADTDNNMLRFNTPTGHWEIWIDRASLVLSAYFYNEANIRTHWQSWLACVRDGI